MAWQKTPPLATQIEPTYQRFSPGRRKSQYTDTQLLAGGLLSRTTAFYIHHSLWIDDKPTEFPSYEVWAQQVLDEHSKLMFKIGQFELPYAYSPFINMATVFQPQIYLASLQDNDVEIGTTMRGIQLSGLINHRVQFYLAYGAPAINTSGFAVGQREFLGEFRDFYMRFANRDQARNLGFFVYLTHPPRDPADLSTSDRGQRYGLDGRFDWRGFQFYAMAVYGENSDPLGNGKRGFLRGGFIEVDKMFLPWLGLAVRLEAQTTNIGTTRTYSDAKTISLSLYPIRNLKLTAEYQQRDHGRSDTALQASLSF